jgi:ferredoxin
MATEIGRAHMHLADIDGTVSATGLGLRGGFHTEAADAVPACVDGRPTQTLVLVGNVGGSMWDAFAASPELADGAPNALDRWTRRVLDGIAGGLGAMPLYPFGGPPYLPFQRWAMRAEPVAPSPLGILIHPDYGLWHAYRGALAFAEPLDLPPHDARPSPCAGCREKPCLTACPVGAFGPQRYDVPACVGHIAGAAGAACMAGSCLARRACPVGRAFTYGPAQAGYHMQAFLRSNRRP